MKTALSFSSRLLLPVLAASVAVSAAQADGVDVKLELLSSGAMTKVGGYMPQRIALSTNQPAGIKKLPADLVAPLFGEIKLGPAESPGIFFIVLDEPDGKPSRLFVDANGNGDLTDDAPAEWQAKTSKGPGGKELTMCNGGANLKVAYGSEKLELHIPMYRFDKNDPQRAAFATNIFYYGDYGRAGEVKLGEKSYAALLYDWGSTGDFHVSANSKTATTMAQRPPSLLVDVNGDGKFDARRESFPVNKPFNIGGTTYEIAGLTASGGSFQVIKSTNSVEETNPEAPKPALTAGHPAIKFSAKTTDGKDIAFPASYKGKLVMLDFWATWCPPCREEIPHIAAAYGKLHAQGLEILGISLDQKNAEEKLATFTKEHNMPWAQVYDGKFWQAEVATNYFIQSIPHAFLVDGDTGMIVAEGNSLRGEALAATLEKALAKKTKPN